jgi:hypothetical protein
MPIPLVYPIGAGILAIIGLRLNAVSKQKKAAALAAAQSSASANAASPSAASVTPAQVASAAASAGVTVQQLEKAASAAGTTPQAVIASAQQAGSSVADELIAQAGKQPDANAAIAAVSTVAPVLAASVQQAVVTTHDQPPSGDLRVFATASTSQQIGGADKDGVVTVLDSSDPTFALINWTGGRNPAVQGFAKKQFLRNI